MLEAHPISAKIRPIEGRACWIYGFRRGVAVQMEVPSQAIPSSRIPP